MKIMVKKFWVYFLAAVIVVGSIGITNLSAMAEVFGKDNKTGYAIEVVYNQDYTTAVLQGNVQTVKEGVELVSLQNQAGEVLDPHNFSQSVQENGTYIYTLTYHVINDTLAQSQHEHYEDYTEELTVKVDQIVEQDETEMLLSDYTIANFENAKAANPTITGIPSKQIIFNGYQLATYKDKANNPTHMELLTVDLDTANQTTFDNYMRSTGFASGYVDENSLSGLSLQGLVFDSLATTIGGETYPIVYITQSGDDIYYLTEDMTNVQSQAAVLAKATTGQEFQVRYRAVAQTEVLLNLNRTTAENLGVTFEINGREPKWADGSWMDSLYVTTGSVISIEATYPDRYNVANVTVSNAALQNPDAQAVFSKNEFTKLFVYKINSADQISNGATLSVTWSFSDTNSTQGRLIGMVDAVHTSPYQYIGATRFSKADAGGKQSYLDVIHCRTNDGRFSYHVEGPYAGKLSGLFANGVTWGNPSSAADHADRGILAGQIIYTGSPLDWAYANNSSGYTKSNFAPYNIVLWNQAQGGTSQTYTNAAVTKNGNGVFETNVDGATRNMFLGSYTGNNMQTLEYDVEWGNTSWINQASTRWGENPGAVLRYDTWSPGKHMVYVQNGTAKSGDAPSYTEYLTMPKLPTSISALLRKNNISNYEPGTQIPVNESITHKTSDGASVTITLKSVAISRINAGVYGTSPPSVMDAATVIKSYKYAITITNPSRDMRLTFTNALTADGETQNIAVGENLVESIGMITRQNTEETFANDYPFKDSQGASLCTHGGKAPSFTGGITSTDGSYTNGTYTHGNYSTLVVTVPRGVGGVTASLTQNNVRLDSKYLQLCHISHETVNGVEMSKYYYHYFNVNSGLPPVYARLITFSSNKVYNVDVKYQNSDSSAANLVQNTTVTGRNFLSGTQNDKSQLIITDKMPAIPTGKEFGGWKLALYDATNNKYVNTNGSGSAAAQYLWKNGIDNNGAFIEGDLLDLTWVYEQFNIDNYLKANLSAANFEVRMVPILNNEGAGGVSMLRGEVQFFYQGNTGSVHETSINNDEYSHYKGEKETKAVPSNSTVLSFSSHNVLPNLARFKGDWSGNRFSGVKFWFNDALSIINSGEISDAQPDSNGMHVISKLYYDRVFNVRYATNQMSADGISMDGITQAIGEHTLTSGNGSVVTLNSTLANNNQITKWEIQELADANIEHALTVTDGTIDLSSLSSEAKTRLLEMNAANNSAAYTTVTLRGRVTPPMLELDWSVTHNMVLTKEEAPTYVDSPNAISTFLSLAVLTDSNCRYGTDMFSNMIDYKVIRIRDDVEEDVAASDVVFSIVDDRTNSGEPLPEGQYRTRFIAAFQEGHEAIQDGDHYYIKVYFKDDPDTFVRNQDKTTDTDTASTFRVLDYVNDPLLQGINGIVSMPKSITLLEQADSTTLSSSEQTIALNKLGGQLGGGDPDYQWEFTKNRLDVNIESTTITLTSDSNADHTFDAQVTRTYPTNVFRPNSYPGTPLGSLWYGDGLTNKEIKYEVTGEIPEGRKKGEVYSGIMTFYFYIHTP